MARHLILRELRSCASAGGQLVLQMSDEAGTAIVLTREETARVLREVALDAPELLHTALEDRLIKRIAETLG